MDHRFEVLPRECHVRHVHSHQEVQDRSPTASFGAQVRSFSSPYRPLFFTSAILDQFVESW